VASVLWTVGNSEVSFSGGSDALDLLIASEAHREKTDNSDRSRLADRAGQLNDGVPDWLKERVPIHSEREPPFW
jgi:hypothetical protein